MPEGKINVANTTVDAAGHTIDLAALPAKSIQALISRGLTHYLGSEQASKVKARKDKFAEDNEGAKMPEEEVTALKIGLVGAAVVALQEGTIGSRAIEITIDPFEKVCQQVARQMVVETLKANGLKVPKGDTTIEFAGGTKLTMAELIERKMAKDGEAISKEAKEIVADKEKRAKAAKAMAEAAAEKSAEALGF